MATPESTFAGKTLVVGLGKTGMSVVRFLAAKGESVAVTDSRDIPPGLDELKDSYPDVARFMGGFDEKAFLSADRLIVSPGLSLKDSLIQQAIERRVPVYGDIELFAHYADAPVIAITGSNGKTTVTTLIGEMARAAGFDVGVGGNIGTPALDLLDCGHDLFVLELSSFQLETLSSLKPLSAVVLNVSEDHMDRYASLQEYANAKARIFNKAENKVVNRDDNIVSSMPVSSNVVGFTLNEPLKQSDFGLRNIDSQTWICQGDEKLIATDELLISGQHNVANAMAALALGVSAGFSMASMLQALKGFTGLPHRTQFVAEINGIRFFNDSKATNVGSCLAALQGLHRYDESRSVVIMGGDCKGADFKELSNILEMTCRGVILIGRDAEQIAAVIPESVKTEKAVDMKEAVLKATAIAKQGDRVLLSPACASFDMFSGFEERGHVFSQLVREMGQEMGREMDR